MKIADIHEARFDVDDGGHLRVRLEVHLQGYDELAVLLQLHGVPLTALGKSMEHFCQKLTDEDIAAAQKISCAEQEKRDALGPVDNVQTPIGMAACEHTKHGYTVTGPKGSSVEGVQASGDTQEEAVANLLALDAAESYPEAEKRFDNGGAAKPDASQKQPPNGRPSIRQEIAATLAKPAKQKAAAPVEYETQDPTTARKTEATPAKQTSSSQSALQTQTTDDGAAIDPELQLAKNLQDVVRYLWEHSPLVKELLAAPEQEREPLRQQITTSFLEQCEAYSRGKQVPVFSRLVMNNLQERLDRAVILFEAKAG